MFSVIYLVSIVVVNYLFTIVPSIGVFQPVSILVGLIFIFRDFAQREIGHWVIPVMLAGGVISYFMADPFVAVASVAAFLISEGIDWTVYTISGRPMRDRILLSSTVSTPIDSAVFLLMIGFFSWVTFAVMVVSKMVSALVVWWSMKRTLENHTKTLETTANVGQKNAPKTVLPGKK